MSDPKPMTPEYVAGNDVDALRSENAAMREALRDWLKWADGWCPTERCCAHTCKAIAERTAALLKQEPTQ